MGKHFKRFAVFTALIICLFMTAIPASAADNIVLSADAERVEKGGEVLVSLDLGEDANLHAYAAKLSYDKNVFEPIEKNSFQAQENWSDIVYNSENNKFGLINKSGESGSDVLEIKFKVRDDAKSGATSIVVDNVSVSDGGSASNLSGGSVDIYVKENALDDTEATAPAVELTNENISVSSGAGIMWLGILFIALTVLVAAFAVVFFIKAKDAKKRAISTSICAVAAAGLIFGSVWAFTSKQPDVNADGKVDYDDAKDVLEYLLEIDNDESGERETQAPNADNSSASTGSSNDSSASSDNSSSSSSASSGSASSNASGGSNSAGSAGNSGGSGSNSSNQGASQNGSNPDVNNDGKVDIGDVGGIVDNAGKDTEYKVTLGKTELAAQGGQNIELVDGIYYIAKGEKNVTVGFEATVNPHTLIKKAVVGGKSCDVTATKINNTKYYYMASVPAPTAVGKAVEMTVSQVTLDNGKKLDVSGKLSVEVLKDKLTLKNYAFSENGNDYIISFDIDDPDGSLVGGNVIAGGENGERVEITPNNIKAGKNVYTLKGLRAGVKYNVGATARYDLDGERDNGAHEGMEILLNKQIEAVDYALEVKNAGATVDKARKVAVIEFESTTSVSGRYVTKAIINGKAYDAKRVGSTDRYTVEVPYEDESAAVYKITGVILDNEVQLDMDRTIELETFKTAPTAENLKLSHNKANGTIDFSWSLNDGDGTVSSLYAVLTRNGKAVETKKISSGVSSVSFAAPENECAGAYKAEIAADFELIDGDSHKKETLASAELEIAVEATVKAFAPSGKYAAKGEALDFRLSVASNTSDDVTGVVINGKKYSVSRRDNGEYTVKYTAQDKAGAETIKLEEIIFSNVSVKTGASAEIEVLKDKPEVKDFVFDDSERRHIVSFTLNDADGAFISGELAVENEKGERVQTIALDGKSGDYKYELELKENGAYHISLSVTYDLDSDRSGAENRSTEIMAEKDIEVLVDYKFTFGGAKLESVDYDNRSATISFNSTNASKYYGVSKVVVNGKEYGVKRSGDSYTVTVALDSNERAELVITKAILDDMTEFDIDPSQTGFIVFKKAPAASIRVTAEKKTIDVGYSITDEDSVISSCKIVLKNADGEVIAEKALKADGGEISGMESFGAEKAGVYTAELIVSYDTADGREHKDVVLSLMSAEVKISADAVKSEVSAKYVKKNGSVDVSYTISSNTDEQITALTINGGDYPIAKQDGNVYTVSYAAGDKAGAEEIHLTGVKYSDKTADVDSVAAIEVLKDKPEIKDFVFDDSEDKHIVSFALSDGDGAFVSGELTAENEKGEKVQTIALDGEEKEYKYELNIKENGLYHVSLSVTYDLDSDRDGAENRHTDVMAERDIEVLVDYKFTFSGAEIVSIDNESRSVTISFKSTNASKYYGVSSVTVNGRDYGVKRNGDSYTVTVVLDSAARTELTLTKAVLEDMRSFDVEPSETGFVVFKNSPAAQLEASAGRTSIDLSYNILDDDSTISDFRIELVNGAGKIVAVKDSKELGSKLSGSVTFDGLAAGEYGVRTLASFDAADGLEHKNEEIGSKAVSVAAAAEITKCEPDKKYIDKNGKLGIAYTITSNVDVEPSALTVNGRDYPAEKRADGVYAIDYTAGDKAGAEDISVTAVKFADISVPAERKDSIEVLKTAPSVSELDYDGADSPSVSFTLTDDDDALIEGSIVVSDGNGYKNEIPVDKKKSKYDLGIEENGIYSVSVRLTYDLDGDKQSADNRETKELSKKEIEVIVRYNFTFTGAAVKSVDYDGKTVTIGFNSTNASIYKVAKVTINGAEYDVAAADGDSYTVKLRLDSTDRTELNITQAELEDHKRFSVDDVSLVVFKKAPSATVNAITGEDVVNVSYIIADQENIAENVRVVLKTADGEVKGTEPVKGTEGTAAFDVQAGAYLVEIVADYNAVDGKTHKDEVLVSDDVIMPIDIDGISGKISKSYVKKGETAEVIYTVEDNTYEEIKAFTVSGRDYPAESLGDGKYKISYKAGNAAGVEKLDVTAVKYATETVAVEYSGSLEVLKDAPTVTGFDYDGSEKSIVSFALNDPDDAFISGTLTATYSEGKKTEITLEKNKNSYDLGLKENGKYGISVNVTYDLDGDKDDKTNQKTEELYGGEIQVIADYKFKFENAAVKSVDNKNATIQIGFESTNASVYPVTRVTVNGGEYDAVKVGDTSYTVSVPLQSRERAELNITGAELEDHKKFGVSATLVVFKTAPSASLNITHGEDKIDVGYVVIDNEGIAENIKLVLCDVYGEEIAKRDVKARSLEGSEEFAIEKAGTYKVKLLASYDAVDGLKHTDEELTSDDIVFAVDIDKITGKPAKDYVEKGESVDITYTVEDNTYEDIKSFTIGGKDYPADKLSDGEYRISFSAGESAGAQDIEVTSVNYGNESVGVSCRSTVEVLKDVPKIEGFGFDGSEKSKISFKLVDPDDAFVSGTIVVTGDGGFKKEIAAGKLIEDYELGITKNGVYDVSVNITYDRDGDRDNDKNQTSAKLAGEKIQVIVNYEFKLTNARVQSVDNGKKTAVIAFDSANASIYKIAKVVINGKEYTPKASGDSYTVEVKLDDRKRTELKMTQAELEDKKTFELDKSFAVFKKAPSAELETKLNKGSIHASYTVTDDEEIAENIKLVLKNSNGDILNTVPCQELKGETDFTIDNAGSYIVELLASYDAVDGLTHSDEALKSNGVDIAIDVESVSGEIAKKYFEKNENVEIFYTVIDNTYEDVASFTINGKEYKPEKQDDGRYKVNYKASGNAEEEKLTLTAVGYSNITEDAECVNSIEVLKDAPTVTDTDYNGAEKSEVSFKLNDPDGAFISGKIVVSDTNGFVKELQIEKGKSKYDLGLDKNGLYTVSVNVLYDRDSDISDKENQTERELHSGNIQVFVDYAFTFTNQTLKSVDNKTRTVTLGFESTNASIYNVSKVTINGKDYSVERTGNIYTVSVVLDKAEKTVLNITGAELEDHKKFSASGSFTVFLNKPSAAIKASKSGNKVNVDYTITDDDNTLTGANVSLKDANGAVLKSVPYDGLKGSASFEIENAGSYTAELTASYNAVDGLDHIDEPIASQEVSFAIEVKSVSSSVAGKYVNKGANVDIIYTVEDNTYEDVSAFIIGKDEYKAEKQENGSYKVAYTAPDRAGAVTLELTAVKYSGGEVKAANTVELDVLKDAPTISDFDYDGSETPTVSFKLNDPDGAFVSGKLTVTDADGKQISETTVDKNKKSYVLDVKENGLYSVSASIVYDLDSNNKDGENKFESELLKQTVQVFVDYDFTITKPVLQSVDAGSGTVKLAFDSTNKSMYKVVKVTVNNTEYEASRVNGNTYTVDVKLETLDRTVLEFTQAELEDHKKFPVNESITVFKSEPTAELTVGAENSTVTADYSITDNDGAISSKSIALKDGDGRIISSEPCAANSGSVRFSADKSGTYTVELTADYDLVNGNGSISKTLASGEATVDIKASVESGKADSKFVQKGAEIGIYYKVTDNTDEEVSSFTINGADYTAVPQENGEYRAAYSAGATAGEEKIELSEIKYPSGSAKAEHSMSIEVLKDKPAADIVFDNSGEQPKLTVNLKDDDEAVLSATAVVMLGSDRVLEAHLNEGENDIDITSLVNNQAYTVNVVVDYDLDSNRDDGVNRDTLTQSSKLVIIKDYNFSLDKLAVEQIDKEDKDVTLSFESSNISMAHFVDKVEINGDTYSVSRISQQSETPLGTVYKYNVIVPYTDESRQEFVLTKAILDNMKAFDVFNQKAVIFKNAPTADNIKLDLGSDERFTLTFDTNDEDKTLTALHAALKDYKGETVETAEIKAEAVSNYSHKFNLSDVHAGIYTVDLTADYELADGSGEYKNRSLGTAEYEVMIQIDSVDASLDKEYAEKGAEAEITYTITDNAPYYVKNFEIITTSGGKDTSAQYDVTRVSDAGDVSVYTVKVKMPDKAGTVKYALSKINYIDDDEDVNAEYTAEVKNCETSVEVLRDIPQNTSYTLDEKGRKITFDVVDGDGAVTSVTAEATNKATKSSTALQAEKGNDNIYTIDLKSLENAAYDISIKINYDRDSDRGNAKNAGTLTIDKEIDFSITYAAAISGTRAAKVDSSKNTVTLAFNANITANGEAASDVELQDATVNGQIYTVTKSDENGEYTVEVPYKNDDRQTVAIESVTLTNGLKFNCTSDNSAVIFKTAPKASGLNVTEKSGVVSASFKLTDEDGTISGFKAVLRDSAGNIAATKEFDKIPSGGSVSVSFDKYRAEKAGDYKVSVLATYDRTDGATHSDEELASSSATVEIRSSITAHSGAAEYVEKGADITVTYTISDNTDDAVEAVYINNEKHTAVPTDNDGQYTVMLKAPEGAGKTSFKADKVVYGGKDISLASPHTVSTEVLKSEPQIMDYTVDAENYTATFNVLDDDDALISGKALIVGGEKEQTVCTFEKKGAQSFDIPEDLDDDVEYRVVIKLTYDRDSDKKAGSANCTTDKEMCDELLELKVDYNVVIRDIKAISVDRDEKTADITFTADDDDKHHIERIYIEGQDQEYYAEYDEKTGVYTVNDLPYFGKEDERQEIRLTKFYIETGIEYDLSEQNVSFVIFKNKPTVENFEVEVSGDDVYFSFNIVDNDNTLSEASTSLTKSTFNEVYGNTTIDTIDEKELALTADGKYRDRLKLADISTAYNFNVNVLGGYDAADGEEHSDETIGTAVSTVKISANILSDSITSKEDMGGDEVGETIEKNKKIRVAFEIADNTEWDATRMVINNEVYNVSKDRPTDKGSIYFADVITPETAGKAPFTVSRIYYGNNESDVNYKTREVTILKAKPGVEDYDDGGTADTPYLKFTFSDPDGALTSKAVLTIQKENTNDVVYTEELTNGKKVDLDLSDESKYPEGIYQVIIKASYNMYADAEKEVKDASLLNDNVLGLEKRLQIKKGYNLKASLLPVELFQDGMPFCFYVNMNSIKQGTNITRIKLAKLREQPDGSYSEKEYDEMLIPYDYEGRLDYIAWIDGWSYEKGLTNVYYESLVLDNGEELILDWFSDYTIVNKYPEAVKTTLKEDVINDCVNASVTLSDPDNTINRLRFRLKAANNRVLDEKFLSKNEVQETTSVVFDKKMPMTSQYKLEVIAEFDPEGRGNYYTNTLSTASISSAERVVIRDHLVDNPYPDKGGDVVLGYQMAHNLAAGIEIIGMKINGEQVDLSSQDGDWYKFVMPAPTNSGVYEYTATDIILSSKTYNLAKKDPDENGEGGYNLQPTDKVDVLKDAPYVTGMKLEDDPAANTAKFSFNVEDPDGALVENSAGTATVNGNSLNIIPGENTLTFKNIPKDQELTLDVLGNYDLDTNELENEPTDKNLHNESILDGGKAVPFKVLDDYGLTVSNVKAVDANGDEERFFDKGASIDMTFESTNKTPAGVDRVVVNGSEYDATQNEDGTYKTRIKGLTNAGETDLKIDSVILENGKTLDASNVGAPATIEIRKDKVSVQKFSSTSDDKSMTLSVTVKDDDDSLIGDTLDVTITDSSTNETVTTTTIEPNKTNEIKFNTNDSRKYDVSIKADYTRDIENQDVREDEEIYKKKVSMDSRAIEMKDILDVKLFKVENGKNTQIDVVDLDDIQSNLKDYVVRVDMENLPSFYSNIESTEVKGDKLVLKVSYEGAVDYSEGQAANKEYIEIEYQYISGKSYSYGGSFESLLRRMREKPNDTFTLDKNYDASTYVSDDSTYFGKTTFKGTINGNGYTISNLSKPLFDSVESANINNLYLTNVTLTSLQGARAPLANSISKTTVKGVHISNVKTTSYGNTTSGYGSMAGMVGDAKDNSKIEESSVTNLTLGHIYLTHLAGGMVRELKNSTVSNCYVEGIATTGWWGNGGIAGSADQYSTVENCISNMSLSMYINEKNAGIVGSCGGATLKNNIAIATKNNGCTSKVFGNTIGTNSDNNYQLSDVPGNNNDNKAVKTIESSKLSESFYENELKLDPKIWDLSGASATKVPTLRSNLSFAPYVPSQERIKDNTNYDPSKEVAYNNLYKLMPFYDASYIIDDAAKHIQTGDDLNTKRVNGVIPYDSDGNIVYVLDTENYDKLSKITIVYDDLSTQTYDVSFDIYFGNVACYDIPKLNLKYTYNHYVIDSDSPIIDELIDELPAMGSYGKALDPITPNRDPDTYKYYYDEELGTRENLRDFVIKVLANGNYSVTTGDSVINTAIRSELTSNNKLLNMLYAYNYFMRWYSFDIEQFSMADMLMFKGDIFNDTMNLDALTSALLSNPGSTMRPNGTHDFYSGYISSYTGIKTLPEFLDYFISSTEKYKNADVNDWFTDNFNGVMREVKMDEIEGVNIKYDEIKYRAWEHLSVRPQNILPLLNMPDKSTYIISYPTMMAIGSVRNYIRDPEDPAQMESFNKSMDSQAKLMKTYYNMFLGVLSNTDVVALFNSKDDYLYDSTRVYESADAKDRVFASNTTNEPHMKWFAVPLGVNYYHAANYAVAGGRDIWYGQGNYFGNMLLYSHEAAHNQDGPLYFKGYGRKSGTGAEDYTTGFFTQTFDDGSPQLNGMYYYDDNSTYSGNLTPERINSYTKINDFYKKMFQTTYFLDYLMGEAFLELNSDQQAAVATTIKGTPNSPSISTVSKADIEGMNLSKVEDLTKNKLILASGISQSIYDVRWYDVHSTTSGIASNPTFHYLAYAMLGYAGYDDGFVQYCGKIYDGDLNSLIAISDKVGDHYKTFEEFKTGEYEKIMKHRDEISYINADEVVEEFKEALILDAQDMTKSRLAKNALAAKKKYYLLLKKNTDDFRGEIFQNKDKDNVEVHVSTAKDFVDQITKNKYAKVIVDKDLDFSAYNSGTSVVGVTFLGSVQGKDGHQYKLENLSRPLFRTLGEGVEIKDLTVSNANIALNYEGAGALSRTVDKVTVSGVKLENVTVDSGNKNNAGGLFGSASNSTFTNIDANGLNVSGGKNVGGIVGNLVNGTVTGGTIDNVNVKGTSDCIGGLIGEANASKVTGIKISNVTTIDAKNSAGGMIGNAIDTAIESASAETVKIENARNNIGGLVGNLTSLQTVLDDGTTSSSTLSGSYARDITITAITKLGGLVGNADKGGKITTSSSAAVNIGGTADSIGGFIGELKNVEVSDCYSANAVLHGRSYIGGFVGYTENPTITNCYSHGSVTNTSNLGGFIGTARTSAKLENNVAFASVATGGFKFDPNTDLRLINSGYKNNYEVEEYPGRPSKERGNIGENTIKPVGVAGINSGFFTATLKWNTATWDLSKVESGGLPRLQGTGNALKETDTFSFKESAIQQTLLMGGAAFDPTDAVVTQPLETVPSETAPTAPAPTAAMPTETAAAETDPTAAEAVPSRETRYGAAAEAATDAEMFTEGVIAGVTEPIFMLEQAVTDAVSG